MENGDERSYASKHCWSDVPRIQVTDPMEHNTWDQGRFTTYRIVIKTNHPSFNLKSSSVRRRFSEVLWLRNVLKTIHTTVKIPKAPPKKFTWERFHPAFIKRRQVDIADFLNEIIKTEPLLSDTAVHLFLQSDLTTTEIDEYFKGNLPQEAVDQVWMDGGFKRRQCNKSRSDRDSFGEMRQISEADGHGCLHLQEVSDNIPTPCVTSASVATSPELSSSSGSMSGCDSETHGSVSSQSDNVISEREQNTPQMSQGACVTNVAEISNCDSNFSIDTTRNIP